MGIDRFQQIVSYLNSRVYLCRLQLAQRVKRMSVLIRARRPRLRNPQWSWHEWYASARKIVNSGAIA